MSNTNINAEETGSMINLENPSFIGYIQESLIKNWESAALTDYQGQTILYKEMAASIEKAHILYRSAGLNPGDKIAICAKNCSNWAVAFFSIITYGAVPVPILADFKADYIHNIVNHSEARLLYAGDAQWKSISTEKMPAVKGYFLVSDLSLLQTSERSLEDACDNIDNLFSQRFPNGFSQNDVDYYKETDTNNMAVLNYTSGTTSFPKGVMIPYRALRMMVKYSVVKMYLKPGSSTVCMLPLAHMFGMMFELIYDIALGCHIHFLTKIPSPKIIFQTFAEFKPTLIITVPLVIEKVVQNVILPVLNKPSMRIALHVPILRQSILKKIRQKLLDAFGGEMKELIIGGAALSKDVEDCLRMLHFPFTVGYGANECCSFGCPDRKKCYEDVSRKALGIEGPDHHCASDILNEGYRFSKAMTNKGFISREDIEKVYLKMGFSNFKIEGRSLGSALILEFILYYLTKPECQLLVREELYLDNTLDLF